jgi:acetyl esterase/lipase
MKTSHSLKTAVVLLAAAFTTALAQQPESSRAGARRGSGISWEQVLRSDANQDGKISKEEFRGPPPLFTRLDKNADGLLTKEEHDAAAPAPAPAERTPKVEPSSSSSTLPATAPAQANVAYGPHERNVLDLWLAKPDSPAPLAIFIHGGGFIGGSKEQINARELRELLDAGISVAALNYRLLAQAPLPAAHQDVARAVQFLRAKAGEWNLDKTRFGGFGGSAGAQLVMYLAFHDDLADPASSDPVARESSRLACVAPNAGQITMDMKWWDQHVPGYAEKAQRRRSNQELFGTDDEAAAMKINASLAALSLISRDDPPVFMSYGMAPESPLPTDGQAQNWMIHHVIHGIELKKRCDQLGVEAHLKYPGAQTRYNSTVEFFKAKLLPEAKRSAGDARQPSAAPPASPLSAESSTAAVSDLKWNSATVRSPDDKEVALLWAAPRGEGPFPVVMFVHGAPGGIGEQGLRGIARSGRWAEFAKRGFLVCLTDYRGHPDGRPFAVLDGAVNAADDLAAIVKHLATLPQCDAKRLALIGGSLGGMTALEAATTGRLAPACLVLNAPATFPLLRLRGRPEAGRELADADFDKAGALARVRKVSCPVLIVQGTADGLTPLNKTLHALLKEAGKDSRLELFEGQGHSFANGPENDAYHRALQMTAEFVARHTKLAAVPAVPPQSRGQAWTSTASSTSAAWAEPKAEPEGMKYRTFASKAAGTEVSYLIYLPPDYETAKDRRYPVVYWLHGRGGSQTGASQFVRRLDPAIRAGKAQPMIVVGVNGLKTSSFVDSADGKTPVQTVIVKELIPHVDATYRTIASREGRAIEGFSMGGAGAPKIGFKYPELFGAVSILAGALHDLESYKSRGTAFQVIYGGRDDYFEANSPWRLVEQNADKIRGNIIVRIVVGGRDNLQERNAAFHQLLDKLNISHDFTVVPDAPHSPGPLLDGAGDATWAFYQQAFGKRR